MKYHRLSTFNPFSVRRDSANAQKQRGVPTRVPTGEFIEVLLRLGGAALLRAQNL
jgi:hypothetical protein